jgi:hypothetical protein
MWLTSLHRSNPTSTLQTLPSYLQAASQILSLILQIPPVDPSTGIRTILLLRLTDEVLTSIFGYKPDPATLTELTDWLDDLDQAWVCVIRREAWDAVKGSGVPVTAVNVKSSPMTVTERTRLKSLLLTAIERLDEWLERLPPSNVRPVSLSSRDTTPTSEDDVSGPAESVVDVGTRLQELGLAEAFDDLFGRTLDELGPQEVSQIVPELHCQEVTMEVDRSSESMDSDSDA